ncbi:ELKS/Rab6-interacting/CAST family member 1 isoform X1 [Oncorhynchus tshawytscha]|uniref:ELKS/Rab6-interacting/CAST family member 1 isoform X1 n=1 Tax=Oncorhynchus tshawytscha TaxID=74940 RepID=UPI001C3CA8B8|nr:ELKS/Rab6-interacting/CAST family member 1 isoform X1 [Oncorhynchus tshawytscha]
MYGSSRSVAKMEGNNGSSQSPGRSPCLPRSPRLGHRRTNSTGGPGGKTLSMENIQSLNAAYATSGPMYLSDNEVISQQTQAYPNPNHDPSLPKSTMTLGRSGAKLPYGVRTTAMGSNPNISQGGGGSSMPSDSIVFGCDHVSSSQSSLQQASTVPHSLRQTRDNTIMDLQTQLKEVLRENELLRGEVDVKESKLSSSMNSIKTFWSPELKKERALRKDEVSKISVWKEQYRVVQDETQHLQMTVQALQDELRTQRDLNQLFQQDCSGGRPGEPLSFEPTEENFHRLQAEHQRQAKELFLLRKTLEEMELRIDSQKQTLGARDQSIKKLLEMLQSKGLSAKASEEDHERTRRLAEAEMHIHHLDSLLEQKDKETNALREELHRRSYEGAPESAKTKALQTVIEMKDSKVQSLERGLRDLEEEIEMLKSNGALSTEEREEEMKQMEVYRSHSKFMKNKVEQLKEELSQREVQGEELKQKAADLQQEVSAIDQVKQDLSRKETELMGMRTKLETLTNQFSDSKQHIEVLKESLTAKEQRSTIIQTEVDALRLRLEEKDSQLNKKSNQIQETSEEKGTLSREVHDLKDMLEVKERKVNVLQKKIENLQEQLRDKEKQMSSLKDRVRSLQTDTSNTDTALTTLEEALAEKERIIERLKEQRDRDDREKTEDIESNKKELKELREKLSLLQGDLSDREVSYNDQTGTTLSLLQGDLSDREVSYNDQTGTTLSLLQGDLSDREVSYNDQTGTTLSLLQGDLSDREVSYNDQTGTTLSLLQGDLSDREVSYNDQTGTTLSLLQGDLSDREVSYNDQTGTTLSLLQGDLSDRETNLLDLKEHASSLASSGLKKDSKLKSLEMSLEQRKDEFIKMENQLKKAQNAMLEAQANTELSQRIVTLEQEVTRHREDSGKAQVEVDRLLEILGEMENEKNDKDKKINELENFASRQVKDQTKTVAHLKHKEQVEKSKNAQLVQEVRKREDNLNESSQHVKVREVFLLFHSPLYV